MNPDGVVITREAFRRKKSARDRHLLLLFAGGFVTCLAGGLALRSARWLIDSNPAVGVCFGILGTAAVVLGPFLVPLWLLWVLKHRDIQECPYCGTNLLNRAKNVQVTGRCFHCGNHVVQ